MQVIQRFTLLLLVLVALYGCKLSEKNSYLEHFTEVNPLVSIQNVADLGNDYYPELESYAQVNLCLESYQRLKDQGYVMLGYSLFEYDGKLSEGLAIQTGKKLGAHKVLLAREAGNSGMLKALSPTNEKGYKGALILEEIVHKPKEKQSILQTEFYHSVLFLVKRSID
jgi:hypothetical protein